VELAFVYACGKVEKQKYTLSGGFELLKIGRL
jgi:hypothetical protein